MIKRRASSLLSPSVSHGSGIRMALLKDNTARWSPHWLNRLALQESELKQQVPTGAHTYDGEIIKDAEFETKHART